MAETTLDLRDVPKVQAYADLEMHVEQVLDGVDDEIAAMATISALTHHAFGHLWTGFYRVVEPGKLLRVGPYQGSLGCLTIEFGRGVCGVAAQQRRTVVVPDVAAFPGHIVCDALARSEIVVPVFDARAELLAVLDVDSAHLNAFDDEDRRGLERVVRWFARRGASVRSTPPASASSSPSAPMRTIAGYSDRINHAFAFAAKHHDEQVRRGTRPPYLTQPANVAVILTRYGQGEEIVLAAIVHDFVEDSARKGQTREMLDQRVGEKFGTEVLETALAVSERKLDDDGVDMEWDERKDDLLRRLAGAGDGARWVYAADQIHEGSALLADLRRTAFPGSVWSRFRGGRDATVRWYRRVHDRLGEVGFAAPIMAELREVVVALEGSKPEATSNE